MKTVHSKMSTGKHRFTQRKAWDRRIELGRK